MSRWAGVAALSAALLALPAAIPQPASAAVVNPAVSGYGPWEPLGGGAAGAPAATSWGGGRVDVFVDGPGASLWHKWYVGGWKGWEDLGAPPGGLGSDPAAVAWGAGRIDVFVRGADGALWQKSYGGAWSGWMSLGGTLVGAPTVASWGPGRLDVFVEGTDASLYHRWYDAGGWSGWERRGGLLTAAPAAVSWGPGRIDVAVRGSDDAAWHTWFDGHWHGFENLGGSLTTEPALSSQGAGELELFGAGSDSALAHRVFLGAWAPWQSLGGTLTSGAGAVSSAANRTDVFARGTDGGVWHLWTVAPDMPAAGWQTAVASATAQLGKPYQWAGAGPAAFDCSGLTRWAWAAAGVALPHLAQGQYAMAHLVAIADLQPGDLVFYGTPANVYHVGIYVGNGTMIHAPYTGTVVQYQSIYFSGLLAGGRLD